jgi:dipeptidyl aminopeptidase/acylaminoacyl peptidase
MPPFPRPRGTHVVLLALLGFPGVLSAQDKPVVPPADFGKWESLNQGVLSPDGRWLAYIVNRVNEENELRLTAALAAAHDTTIVSVHGAGPVFSANSAWLAWHITVGPTERAKLLKEKKPVQDSLGLRDLRDGTATLVPGVETFAFSPDGRFLAMRAYAAAGKQAADLIVQDLAQGTRMSFGNVSEYEWADAGGLLALTIDTEAGAGNAVELYDAATGVVKSLDSSPSRYRALAWGKKKAGDDLAVLRTISDTAWRDTSHVVLAWTRLRSRAPVHEELDPAKVAAIPDTLRISETYTPVWAEDGSALYFGLRPRLRASPDSAKKKDDAGPRSAVEVWSVNDVREIPLQRFQEQSDLRRSLLTQWRVAADRVVRIGTDLQESASILRGDRFATETDRTPYTWGAKFGRRYEDLYVVDLATGARKKALERIRYFFGGSSTGKYLAWYDSAGYWSYTLATGSRTHLSAKVPTDLTDPDWDTPAEFKPMADLAGWTKDDAAFLVFDAHDLWRLAADGTRATRLTNNAPDDVQASNVRLDRNPDDPPGIDASRPIYLTLYGRHSKKGGFARVMPNGTVERLVYDDARYGRLAKADSADVFAYVREDYDDSPDWFVAAADLEAPRQVSHTNPFQSDYAWGHTELVSYTTAAGRALQAILVYPAQYDASKKYPMIVYTYELLSQNLHNYSVPSERNYYDPSVFSANGYFVLMPDIVFRARDPGISVLECVVPAVHAIVARGLVDSTRVGHVGHSWGGYEAAFLPTRTHIFAASVAGASITDMFSFAGQMHWGPGIPEWDHLETGQARMEVPYWEDRAAYERNSPEAKVNDLTTPILIEVGDADGTVDFHQGVEFFNDIRRAGRTNAVLLLYPGADHGLRKEEDQVDYHNRILQWFGHYLKGDPAPAWITDGVSWLDRKAALGGG